MGRISEILRESWGIKPTGKKAELSAEKKAQQIAYFKRVKSTPTTPIKKPRTFCDIKQKNEFIEMANKLTGGYTIYEGNQQIISTLFYYFTCQNDEFLKAAKGVIINKPTLNKGILLIGGTGSGKTQLFNIFKALKWRKFSAATVYNVVEDFEIAGEKGIPLYFKGNRFFDDLGTENEAMYFGKREDVFTRILEKRYTAFKNEGLRTYITTNLSVKQIVSRYGYRLEGRIEEMFNVIYLGKGNYRDFRIGK